MNDSKIVALINNKNKYTAFVYLESIFKTNTFDCVLTIDITSKDTNNGKQMHAISPKCGDRKNTFLKQSHNDQASMLRHTISKKIITPPPLQLKCFFIGLNESSCQGLFNHAFFLKNTKYLKSYHGRTKILNIFPFFKKIIPLSLCYY